MANSRRALDGNSGQAETPSGGIGHLHFAFEDPLSALPDTARNLLLAAKGIVATDGFQSLTLNSVAMASGENKAMIAYYFGNKAGLIAAVLDSVIHDEYIGSQNRMRNVDTATRSQHLIEEMRRMDAALIDFQVFFELLPHMLRNENLRRRIALLYRWYWSVKLEWLGSKDPAKSMENPDLLGLSQVLSAVIDGLAIQVAIDPDVDVENPYRILRQMLEGTFILPTVEDNDSQPVGSDRRPLRAKRSLPTPD